MNLAYKISSDINTQGIFSKRFACYGFFSGMFFTIIFPPIYINNIQRSRIPNIRLQFINGQPLSKVFAPPKTKQNCQSECEMCKLSSKPNLCLKKNVVYKIECSICGIVYIGETGEQLDHGSKNT